MEILVPDNSFNTLVISIGCRLRPGQDILGVKDIESLVFHGAHVEIINRHNHIGVQVVFSAKNLFIPAHAFFERLHGMTTFVFIALFNKDMQGYVTAGHSCKVVLNAHQISGNQGKKITGFGKGIVPGGKMTTIFKLTLLQQITVGQYKRTCIRITDHCSGKYGHYIGSVRVTGNTPKTFSLALGTVVSR